MPEHGLPPIEMKEAEYAYEIRTHFLNPVGKHDHRYMRIYGPDTFGIDAALIPPNQSEEVAWVDFFAHGRVTIEQGEQSEELWLSRKQIGGIFLTTNWRHGQYEFQPLSELLESDVLPLYTAAWLARYMLTNRTASGGSRLPPELAGLEERMPRLLTREEIKDQFPEKKSLSDKELKNVALIERTERLGRMVMAMSPELHDWYTSRGLFMERQNPEATEPAKAITAARPLDSGYRQSDRPYCSFEMNDGKLHLVGLRREDKYALIHGLYRGGRRQEDGTQEKLWQVPGITGFDLSKEATESGDLVLILSKTHRPVVMKNIITNWLHDVYEMRYRTSQQLFASLMQTNKRVPTSQSSTGAELSIN